jgi:UDP-glucose 4-epimerase
MILVVGGLNGFVGSNTTEALAEQGVDCVVTRHKNAEVPRFLEKYIDRHVFIESADATSTADLRKIGEKHKIDGIVDLMGVFTPAAKSPIPDLKAYFDMLVGVFQVAEDWKVNRLMFSSTGGMYFGLEVGPMDEERPLPLPSFHPLIAYQKIVEVGASEFARGSGISSICVRLGGMFGPCQDPGQGSLAQRLVHAALGGEPAELEGVFGACADDGVDLCYIKDVARAIALIQTAEKLPHDVYNVSSGRITLNRELVEAIEGAVPGFKADLPPGRSPGPPLPVMDTERLRADTGFSPAFDIHSAVRNYIEWLKAGNPK